VGLYDTAETPKLVIDSGDTVSIETWLHGMDEIKPGVTIDEIVKLRLANDGADRIPLPAHLRQRRRTGDTIGNPHYQNCDERLRFNFNLPETIPTSVCWRPSFLKAACNISNSTPRP